MSDNPRALFPLLLVTLLSISMSTGINAGEEEAEESNAPAIGELHEAQEKMIDLLKFKEEIIREFMRTPIPDKLDFSSKASSLLGCIGEFRINDRRVVRKLFDHIDLKYDPRTMRVGILMGECALYPVASILAEIKPDIGAITGFMIGQKDVNRLYLGAWLLVKCTSDEIAPLIFKHRRSMQATQDHPRIKLLQKAVEDTIANQRMGYQEERSPEQKAEKEPEAGDHP